VLPITSVYAGLLALLFLALSWRVVTFRRGNRVSLGDGDSKDLRQRSRMHANFAEYTPIGLILLACVEFGGACSWPDAGGWSGLACPGVLDSSDELYLSYLGDVVDVHHDRSVWHWPDLARSVVMQRLALLSILVPEYDEGIAFFVGQLGFDLLEDTPLTPNKRWVRVGPKGDGTAFLLARAVGDQKAFIGKQGGGRVWLFLETDDFARDHAAFTANGISFCEPPRVEPYGTVAVFEDPWGNRWDLIEFTKSAA